MRMIFQKGKRGINRVDARNIRAAQGTSVPMDHKPTFSVIKLVENNYSPNSNIKVGIDNAP